MQLKVAIIEDFCISLQRIEGKACFARHITHILPNYHTERINNDIFFRCFRHVFSIGRRVFLPNKYAVVDKKPIFIHYDAILWIKTGNIIRPAAFL